MGVLVDATLRRNVGKKKKNKNMDKNRNKNKKKKKGDKEGKVRT